MEQVQEIQQVEQPQQAKPHRTRAQDIAKGMMIIAVVFFHCFITTSANPSEAAQAFSVLKAMFPFLLSSFFFYAGYNYTANDRTFKQNIIRRAKQLLIPMVIAFVISTTSITVMELIFRHDDVGSVFVDVGNTILYCWMTEPLAWILQFPQSGGIVFELVIALGLLWFLFVLFVASFFFYLLVKHTNKKLSTLISVVIGLLLIAFCIGQFVPSGTYLPYYVQCWPVVIAIMLTAAYLRQSHFLNRRITSKKDSLLIGLNALIAEGIVVGISLVCYFYFGASSTGSLPGSLFDAKLKGFDAFVAFAFGILGTYFLHTVCRLIKFIPVVSTCLQWVGNHSAIFYMLHPIFIELVGIVGFQKQVLWGGAQAYFYVAVVVAFLTGLCLLFDLIFKRKHNNQKIEEVVRKNEAPEDI